MKMSSTLRRGDRISLPVYWYIDLKNHNYGNTFQCLRKFDRFHPAHTALIRPDRYKFECNARR